MQKIVFIAIFASVAAALGLTFLAIPNLELVTTTFFLAGYFLGARDGMIAAVLGEFIYSLLNPMGSASPPLLAAQLIGMAVVAFAGSQVAKYRFFQIFNQQNGQTKKKPRFQIRTVVSLGFIGLILTFIFDVLTTISFLIFMGLTVSKFIASLFFGFYFYLAHLATNTLIFAILLPLLIPVLRDRLPKMANN